MRGVREGLEGGGRDERGEREVGGVLEGGVRGRWEGCGG